ncbi:MAG TPA: LiaF domain-containing protein [Cyclobacteriaceae bacterium]|nr:LiaF domain-containing protein [Cyclobacteriaceae bacterium]
MRTRHRHEGNNLWFGLIILAVGVSWLLAEMNLFLFPAWLFSWKVLLIGIGFIIGVRRRFAGIGWLIPILIGSFFLLEDLPYFEYEIHQYGVPVAIILVGTLVVYRALFSKSRRDDKYEGRSFASASDESTTTSEDVIEINNTFGSTKKKIISKNFKGGKITNAFGSTELDLSQADIDGVIRIDINQNFGGLELIVPSNWEVKSEVSIMFAGIEENRKVGVLTPGKTLLLTGSCMMGGIEIKSY